jgi:hypothetical protein
VLRVALEILLPLVVPTVLYLVWLWLVRWANGAGAGGGGGDAALGWPSLPWLWLAAAGIVLLAGFLFVMNVGFGTAEQGTYVPSRWVNGHIVPGHIEPRR